MTAITAVLAFAAAPSFAQETTAPPDPVAAATSTADPLAPAPTDTAVAPPPAPTPKVEASRTTTEQARPRSSAATTRSTARPAARPAPAAPAAASGAPSKEAAAPALVPAEPVPTTVGPAPPPTVEPAPSANAPDSLVGDDMLPVAGAVALGLLALGGAGLVARRRKRRRENEEFEARQEMLAMLEAEPDEPQTLAESQPPLELRPADEVRPGPVFARNRAPIHDPVPDKTITAAFPARGNWEARTDSDFLFRRDSKTAKDPVEPN